MFPYDNKLLFTTENDEQRCLKVNVTGTDSLIIVEKCGINKESYFCSKRIADSFVKRVQECGDFEG
jgi:hypothetical protein